MKKIIFLLIIIIFLGLGLKTWAADEATPSSLSTAEVQEKIKERLEKTATTSAQSQNQDKSAIDNSKYFAWVGEILKTDKNIVFIDTYQGEKQAKADDETVILQNQKGSSRKEVSIDKLEAGNFVLTMGTLEDNLILAKRIISTPLVESLIEKKVLFGKVLEIEDTKITIGNSEKHILGIDKNTKIISKNKEIKTIDIQLEDKVYAVVSFKNDKFLQTDVLFVVPGKNNPDKDKTDVPSSASPSASIAN